MSSIVAGRFFHHKSVRTSSNAFVLPPNRSTLPCPPEQERSFPKNYSPIRSSPLDGTSHRKQPCNVRYSHILFSTPSQKRKDDYGKLDPPKWRLGKDRVRVLSKQLSLLLASSIQPTALRRLAQPILYRGHAQQVCGTHSSYSPHEPGTRLRFNGCGV